MAGGREIDSIQEDLDKLIRRPKEEQMEFNVDNYMAILTGTGNMKHMHTLNGCPLARVEKEKDLRMSIAHSLNITSQGEGGSTEGNKIPKCISTVFDYNAGWSFLITTF